MKAKRKEVAEPAAPIRIDIGCGKNKKEGFIGVDQFAMAGVDIVADLTQKWPWADNSVEEANCSHFIEHLTNLNGKWQRVKFFNELYRVLKPGGKCTLAFPHWASARFYGDPTHCEPISEWFAYYLLPEWRETQAPHTDARWNPDGYSCAFEWTAGYGLHPAIQARNTEYQQYAITWYKEAATDIIGTLVARK